MLLFLKPISKTQSKNKIVFIFLLSLTFLKSKTQYEKFKEWYLNTTGSVSIFVEEIVSVSKYTVIVVHGGFGANHNWVQPFYIN